VQVRETKAAGGQRARDGTKAQGLTGRRSPPSLRCAFRVRGEVEVPKALLNEPGVSDEAGSGLERNQRSGEQGGARDGNDITSKPVPALALLYKSMEAHTRRTLPVGGDRGDALLVAIRAGESARVILSRQLCDESTDRGGVARMVRRCGTRKRRDLHCGRERSACGRRRAGGVSNAMHGEHGMRGVEEGDLEDEGRWRGENGDLARREGASETPSVFGARMHPGPH
jgi:hypothetical protein